ncbi:YceI family protein [Verrucomicrobiaceae bacterium 227]
MMTKTILTLASLVTATLVSCKNPADESSEAKTSDAKAVPEGVATGQKWVFTEDSTISFVGSKVTGSHEGGFKKFTGHFYVDGESLSPTGHKLVIDMDSTFSDAEKLTGHLKSPDFFDVEKYPEATFVATSYKDKTLTGNFNLHGVEKSIEIPVTVEKSEDKIHLTSDFFINRFDFNIKFPGKTDDLIREEVVIKFDLHATPAGS